MRFVPETVRLLTHGQKPFAQLVFIVILLRILHEARFRPFASTTTVHHAVTTTVIHTLCTNSDSRVEILTRTVLQFSLGLIGLHAMETNHIKEKHLPVYVIERRK